MRKFLHIKNVIIKHIVVLLNGIDKPSFIIKNTAVYIYWLTIIIIIIITSIN